MRFEEQQKRFAELGQALKDAGLLEIAAGTKHPLGHRCPACGGVAEVPSLLDDCQATCPDPDCGHTFAAAARKPLYTLEWCPYADRDEKGQVADVPALRGEGERLKKPLAHLTAGWAPGVPADHPARARLRELAVEFVKAITA